MSMWLPRDAGTIRRSTPAIILALVIGCGSRVATSPEPIVQSPTKLALRPSLSVGGRFEFHVEMAIDSTMREAATPQHDHGTIALDDLVEVTAAAELRETFTNAVVQGDGDLGNALRRVATELPAAAARTQFDASWQIASTTIDGAQDSEARTMITNLTPAVSFRLLPPDPVAIGDSWTNHWNEAMQSEHGFGAGNVATQVRYTLRGVAPCGVRRCAVIVGDGEDIIPPQSGTTGTSRFHGEQQVDVTDVVPVSRTIESTTVFRGEQKGQPFEYKNVVTVRISRGDS